MSRSGYSEDCEHLNLYRATVERSISGKRGQAFIRELVQAMDDMPEKRLIHGDLMSASGEVCAIGVVCKSRGLDVSAVDVHDPDEVGGLVGISRSLAAEIEYENDEGTRSQETPEERWIRVRKWVGDQIRSDA